MRRALDQRAFEALLRLSPRRFRTRFGDELAAQQAARARRSEPAAVVRRGQWRAVRDLIRQLPGLWRDELAQRPGRALGSRRRRGDGTVRVLFDEVLHAARRLRRSGRLLTALSVCTLGLGVGAAVAMVTVVRGVLIAPLPYGEPDRIVRIFKDSADEGDFFLSGVRFAAAREQLGSLVQVAGFYDYQEEGLDLVREGRGRRLRTLRVSAGYFEALGVAPLLGRTFERREEIPDGAGLRDPNRFEMVTAPAQPVAILSWRLWNEELGGDPGVLGSRLELGGSRFSVVGVMPRGFGGARAPHVGGSADLWLPLDTAAGGVNVLDNSYLSVVARLRDGVAPKTAQAEIDRFLEGLRAEGRAPESLAWKMVPLEETVVGDSRAMLWLLLAAVGVLLVVICLNLSGLTLAQALDRRREMACRSAVGASRRRLLLQAILESGLTSLAGGALGAALAWLAVHILRVAQPAALPRYDALRLDLPVLGVAVAVSAIAAILVGVLPALEASRAAAAARITRGATAGERTGIPRRLLVAVQLALAVVLLAYAGMLGRHFAELYHVDMGFEPDDVLTFQLRLPDHRYAEPERRIAFYGQLFERLHAAPEIEAAAATSKLPGDGHRNRWGFRIAGVELDEEDTVPLAEIRCVAGDLLGALAITLLEGRDLAASDRAGQPPVVLVNRTLATRYFGDESPIGRQLLVGGRPARTVVGVVADVRPAPAETPVPKIYLPQTQFAGNRNWDLSFVVARGGDPRPTFSALQSRVEGVLAELDPNLAPYDFVIYRELLGAHLARERFAATLMSSFAGLVLVLAALGLYGALDYGVRRRRSELGLRLALGAARRRLLFDVAGYAFAVTAAGLAVGFAVVWAGERWLSSVFDRSGLARSDLAISGFDVALTIAVAATLLVVAALAALAPARRTLAIDPAEVLKSQ